jgi:hypothetical protein
VPSAVPVISKQVLIKNMMILEFMWKYFGGFTQEFLLVQISWLCVQMGTSPVPEKYYLLFTVFFITFLFLKLRTVD